MKHKLEYIVLHILMPIIVAIAIVGIPAALLTLHYWMQNGYKFN